MATYLAVWRVEIARKHSPIEVAVGAVSPARATKRLCARIYRAIRDSRVGAGAYRARARVSACQQRILSSE